LLEAVRPYLVVAGLALLLVVAVCAPFYLVIGSESVVSRDAKDWSDFASYAGGLLAPALAFISILLVLYTIERRDREATKRDLLANVEKADAAVSHWLQRSLPASSGSPREYGDVVWGLVDTVAVDASHLKRADERLVELVCYYSQTLALYRDNIDHYFIYQYHHDRAAALIYYLEERVRTLQQMAGPSLAMCRTVLQAPR
jgi:hypothetical protein